MRRTRATSRAERLVTRRQSRGVAAERSGTALNNYPKVVPQALTPAASQRKECWGAVSSAAEARYGRMVCKWINDEDSGVGKLSP
jgi:hypothetical protein